MGAQIKFVQGANAPPGGQALQGVTGTIVQASHSGGGVIVSYNWQMVDVPPGSTVPVGVMGTTSTVMFTPDIPGGYLVLLSVTDNLGSTTSDLRAVLVPEDAHGRMIIPFTASGSSVNINGQTRGWSPFLESYLHTIDRLGDVGGAAPLNGQVLKWNTTNNRYEPGDETPSGLAGGDLSGSYPNPTVSKVKGAAIATAAGALAIGLLLMTTGAAAADWQSLSSATASTGVLPAANQAPQSIGGDGSGTTAALTVTKLQGRAVSSAIPSPDQVLLWDGSQWAPTTLTAPDLPNGSGDWTGAIDSNTVVKIHGASVPAAGALTTGNGLYVSGVSALSYSALNLGGGAGWVTGVLPAANQAAQTMAQDVTGTTDTATVVAIQNHPVSATAPTTSQVLAYTGTQWAPTAPSTIIAGSVTPGTSGQMYITNSTPAAVWDSTLLVTPGSLVTLSNSASIKQTQGGTLAVPTTQTPIVLQPRDPAKAPFFIGELEAATFNTTVDVTMAIGYNTTLAVVAEPAIYWRLEQDYEVTPGTHWFEFYIEYFGVTRANTFRPIYLNVNRATDTGQLLFHLPGHTTGGSIQILSGDETQNYLQILSSGFYFRDNYHFYVYDAASNPRSVFYMDAAGSGGDLVFGDTTDNSTTVFGGTTGVWLSTNGPINFCDAAQNVRAFVETTHGRFTSGGSGTDYKAVLGPQVGNETGGAVLYLLDHATAATGTNYTLAQAAGATYVGTTGGTIYLYYNGVATLATVTSGAFELTTPPTLRWAAAVSTPTITQSTSSAASGQALTIQAQSTSFLNANGGNLNLYAGAGNGTGTSGTIHIGDDKITNVTVGWNATGTTNIQGGILYLQSSGGGGSTYNYTVGFSFISSSGYQTSWNTNQGLWLYDERSSSPGWTLNALTVTSGDVAPKNWTITTQAPYASAVTHLTAGDFIVNVPASVGAGVKYGGFQVQYGSFTMYMGSYQNGSGGAIWSGVVPTANNFILYGDAAGNTIHNAGTEHFFRIGNSGNLGTWTSSLLTVNTAATIGSQTGSNLFVGAMRYTVRTATVSFTVDTTNTDNRILVTATQTDTLPAPTLGRALVFIIDATGGSDITWTLAQHLTEKINNFAGSWVITVPAGTVKKLFVESFDATNWWVFA